jgi:cytochrome b
MKLFFRKYSSTETGVDHELIWGTIGLIALVAARIVPPGLTDFYKCPFHSFTGIPCLTCGMTRSFRHIVHGRFFEAFSLNPLGAMFCIFTILFVVYAFTVIVFRMPRPRLHFESPARHLALRFGLPGILLLNWIYLCCHGV